VAVQFNGDYASLSSKLRECWLEDPDVTQASVQQKKRFPLSVDLVVVVHPVGCA
jgi:hypothetical protein